MTHTIKMVKRFATLLDERRTKRIRTAMDAPSRLELALTPKNPLAAGDATMTSIRAALNKIDSISPRSVDQAHIHEYILAGVATYVYGPSAGKHMDHILKSNRFEKLEKGVIVSAPRRFGKTELVVLICVALIMACPGIRLVCISNGPRAAGSQTGVLAKVKAKLCEVFGMAHSIKTNRESIMYHFSDTDTRSLHSYSSEIGDGCVVFYGTCLCLGLIFFLFFLLHARVRLKLLP